MNDQTSRQQISNVPSTMWMHELESASSKFHITAAWVAAIFDPVFAITDYINIPTGWSTLLVIRIIVSLITFGTILVRKRLVFDSYIVAFVPFMLISLQNAYTYTFINAEGLLGQNLNYMALLIGAAMFVLWHWKYSALVIAISSGATAYFIAINPTLTTRQFFLDGGLLLIVTAIFTIILIRTRYNLSLKEIKARLALQASNNEIQAQALEIKRINENLEKIVKDRTKSLEEKNKALEEYAFINAHKLRSPVASILGLINLLSKMNLGEEAKDINHHLKSSAENLDDIISDISRTIEKGSAK